MNPLQTSPSVAFSPPRLNSSFAEEARYDIDTRVPPIRERSTAGSAADSPPRSSRLDQRPSPRQGCTTSQRGRHQRRGRGHPPRSSPAVLVLDRATVTVRASCEALADQASALAGIGLRAVGDARSDKIRASLTFKTARCDSASSWMTSSSARSSPEIDEGEVSDVRAGSLGSDGTSRLPARSPDRSRTRHAA